MSPRNDLTIVGCGIVGAWVAWLAKERWPQRRILLVERSLAGHGTTLLSPGHLHPYGLNERQRQLSTQSLQFYDEFRRRFPAVPFTDLPLLGIASCELIGEVEQRYVRQGFNVLSESAKNELCGKYKIQIDNEKCIHDGIQSSYSVPTKVVQALVEDFRRRVNCEIWEGTEVLSIATESNAVSLGLADGRTCRASTVILAPGSFATDKRFNEFMHSEQLWLKKIVAMHINCRPSTEDPIIYFHDDDCYLMPRPDLGHWIFSFPAPVYRVPCGATSATSLTITDKDREVALALLGRHFPHLVEHCNGGRVCCDGYTINQVPIAQSQEAKPRVIVAAGGSGLGFRLAPAIADNALRLAEKFVAG